MHKEIVHIKLGLLSEYALKLAQQVEKSQFIPDHVLYVERAGVFFGYEIAKYFDCSISGIYAGRSGGELKSKFKVILRNLPSSIKNYLRKLEIQSNLHDIKTDRNVYLESDAPPIRKKILIVDDAIDSGYSMKAVLDYLLDRDYNAENLKTAVLTTTHNRSILEPDITLYQKTICTGPWSYDSKEYKECWELYSDLKNRIK